MTPIKRRLTYFLRSSSLLRLRISWKGNSYDMSLGYKIDREDSRGRKKMGRFKMQGVHYSRSGQNAGINNKQSIGES